jgi:hypothetical protein
MAGTVKCNVIGISGEADHTGSLLENKESVFFPVGASGNAKG